MKNQSNTLRVARTAVFAAIYALTSLIPISIFIGAQSLLALNIMITPSMALLLSPNEALAAALIGATVATYIAPYQAIFGPPTILLPAVGAFLGSLAFRRHKTGGVIVALFLLGTALAFLIRITEFPFWVIPHVFALVLALGVGFLQSKRGEVPVYTFVSTMCEQAAMMTLAVYLLKLPWVVFSLAFPLMLYERVMGTVGAALLVIGLRKALPNYFSLTPAQSNQ